jgi:tRNA nucleotidyltransferase (CCA-adding enzyme)
MRADESVKGVLEDVREQVTPDKAERSALSEAIDELRQRIDLELDTREVSGETVHVGSTARDTWLSGDRDIDIFIRFPQTIDRETLEQQGLEIGRAVLPEGHAEFAEHPYIKGEYSGFAVDLVPCYEIAAGEPPKSAVDRTPHHTEYLNSKITAAQASDIRVAKQFLKGIGIYGSDLRTAGFSGYLTELLILEYGQFYEFISEAARWSLPMSFDPASHQTKSHDDPLVMVDPTDPSRNVAAVCTAENLARLQHYAREFLDSPSMEFFTPTQLEPLTKAELRDALQRRKTDLIGVVFDTPAIVDDQLYPQLEKSESGIKTELEARDFNCIRSTHAATDRTLLLFELQHATLPAIQRHTGPPVDVSEHAETFYRRYAEADVYGPFVEGNRYVVERDREFRTARELLESTALFDVALGSHIESALQDEYTVVDNEQLVSLIDEFGTELAVYFNPAP